MLLSILSFGKCENKVVTVLCRSELRKMSWRSCLGIFLAMSTLQRFSYSQNSLVHQWFATSISGVDVESSWDSSSPRFRRPARARACACMSCLFSLLESYECQSMPLMSPSSNHCSLIYRPLLLQASSCRGHWRLCSLSSLSSLFFAAGGESAEMERSGEARSEDGQTYARMKERLMYK